MNGDKDNTRKVITIFLVVVGDGLMAYLAVMVAEARQLAINAVSTWTAMALVWYFGGKPKGTGG
jgi:hypothetical protein